MSAEQTAVQILDWLERERDHPRARPGFVGRLATLIGNEEVLHLDAELSHQARCMGKVVVFTRDHLFVQTTGRGQEGLGEVVVRVLPRRTLVSLSTKGNEVLSDQGSDGSGAADVVWPWPLGVDLTYEDGTSVSLPLHGDVWNSAEVAELLPSLLSDLDR